MPPPKKFRPLYQDQAPPPPVANDKVTVAPKRTFTKEELKRDVQELSQRLVDYLKEGNRFERLLAETKAKDITVMMGILTDKMLVLEGQPTQIISQQTHQKIDDVLPALMAEMKRRGVTAQLTERKMDLTLPPQGQA